VVVCQPETGEMALEVVDTLVRSGAVVGLYKLNPVDP
jgi:RecA/RadA recombinase